MIRNRLPSPFGLVGLNTFKRKLWSPYRIPSSLWLDAADSLTITQSAGLVSQWNDKSGNAEHAVQATALSQPSYIATGLNGLPTISSSGANFIANDWQTNLNQTSRDWQAMTVRGNDVYAAAATGGDIYKQTGGVGDFLPLNQTARTWRGLATVGNDVYASAATADIYKQTNGTGDFVPLNQAVRNWRGMAVLGNDVYICVGSGDIYKQTNATGDFIALGQTSRNWQGMAVRGNDVYATVSSGDIYKQTNGTGNFIALGQTARAWRRIFALGNDVYACVNAGDIYKQTNGTGNFIAMGLPARNWQAMTAIGNDVYVCINMGTIYKFKVLANPVSIFAVGFSSSSSGVGRLLSATGSSDALVMGRDSGNFATSAYAVPTADAPAQAVSSPAIMSATNTGSTLQPYFNGTALTAEAGGIATVDNGFTLLSHVSNNWVGGVSEVIVLQGTPATDTATRQKIEGYLAWKWGLVANLPANHPYKTQAPKT